MPGTKVAGFRVQRLLGAGSAGAVYEATQPSLGRTVALRLIGPDHLSTPTALARIDEQQRLAATLHHPNLVPYYAVGEWEGGRYLAMRFIRGTTLAQLLAEGVAPSLESVEALAPALRAAHAVGLAHGRVSAENILVEGNGTTYLADLGLGRTGSPDADLAALTAVLARTRAATVPGPSRRTLRWVPLGAVALAAAVAMIAITRGDGGHAQTVAPAPLAGTTAVGSELAAGEVQAFGCAENPNPNTPACTLAQTHLGGADTAVRRDGVIRRWVVRGASGGLELQVIRQRGGKSFVASHSQPVTVDSPDPHAFATDVSIKAGDRIGVRLDPGATIGSRDGADEAEIARWDGRLTGDPRPFSTAIADRELMLRADVEFGGRAVGPPQLTGEAAEEAPRGRLVGHPIQLIVAGGARVIVVEVGGEIFLDVIADTRLARMAVPDADPDGRLLELTPNCGPAVAGGFCLRWMNPGATSPLDHQYIAGADGRLKFVG